MDSGPHFIKLKSRCCRHLHQCCESDRLNVKCLLPVSCVNQCTMHIPQGLYVVLPHFCIAGVRTISLKTPDRPYHHRTQTLFDNNAVRTILQTHRDHDQVHK